MLGLKNAFKHGMVKTLVYYIWGTMLARCRNKNNPKYKNYGGRGITVCNRWLDFRNFYQDMGDKPIGATIERINNDGNYEPGNCRWATQKEQQNNRRDNLLLTYKNETMTISAWAGKLGMSHQNLNRRITKYGWTIEQAFKIIPIVGNNQTTLLLGKIGGKKMGRRPGSRNKPKVPVVPVPVAGQ